MEVNLPNILVTGTPGTGKTELSRTVAEKIGFMHLNVGDLVKKYDCHEGKNEDYDSYILDEDKLLDVMEPMLDKGGCIVDFHTAEIFPERWFELVLVLRAETAVLYDRLSERGYSDKKRSENVECEIMQVVLQEAQDSYDVSIVNELQSNTLDDLENNLARIEAWITNWKINNNYIE